MGETRPARRYSAVAGALLLSSAAHERSGRPGGIQRSPASCSFRMRRMRDSAGTAVFSGCRRAAPFERGVWETSARLSGGAGDDAGAVAAGRWIRRGLYSICGFAEICTASEEIKKTAGRRLQPRRGKGSGPPLQNGQSAVPMAVLRLPAWRWRSRRGRALFSGRCLRFLRQDSGPGRLSAFFKPPRISSGAYLNTSKL